MADRIKRCIQMLMMIMSYIKATVRDLIWSILINKEVVDQFWLVRSHEARSSDLLSMKIG